MRRFRFHKFNPSGNATVFLHGDPCGPAEAAHYCREAIQPWSAGGEQAAFAWPEERAFVMGGGEFCANAARAFGALLDMDSPDSGHRRYEARIRGFPGAVALEVSGKCPSWRVSAEFSQASAALADVAPGIVLARLPGIAHLLVEAGELPGAPEAVAAGRILLAMHGVAGNEAEGVIWWRSTNAGAEIAPYVRVAGSGTEMLESSCGSGSIALAQALGAERIDILQPSGAVLEVAVGSGWARITGEVRLSAEGHVWLPPMLGAGSR